MRPAGPCPVRRNKAIAPYDLPTICQVSFGSKREAFASPGCLARGRCTSVSGCAGTLRTPLGPGEFGAGVLHVRRVKDGQRALTCCVAVKLGALRRLQRESEASRFVFVSERGSRVDPVEIDTPDRPDGRLVNDDRAAQYARRFAVCPPPNTFSKSRTTSLMNSASGDSLRMTASALATAAPPTTALVSSQFNSMTFCMMTLL